MCENRQNKASSLVITTINEKGTFNMEKKNTRLLILVAEQRRKKISSHCLQICQLMVENLQSRVALR